MARQLLRVRLGSRQRSVNRLFDLMPRLARQASPFRLSHHGRDQKLVQVCQRIPCALLLEDLRRLVGLRVLPGMTGQAGNRQTQQQRRAFLTHPRDRASRQLSGRGRIGPIALQDAQAGKRAQVRGDVATRGLQLRAHGNAIAVVLDVEQHGELQRGRDVERRPEAVGGARGVPAQHHGNAARVGGVPQRLMPIANRLCPAGGWGVLCPDAATRGQHGRAGVAGEIEHHPDVAAAAEGTAARERARGCIFQTHAEREHQRTRAVVNRQPVVRIRELQPEQDLRQVMTARRELVEHLALGHEAGLLDVVEGARSVHERDDADPVGRVAGRLGCA